MLIKILIATISMQMLWLEEKNSKCGAERLQTRNWQTLEELRIFMIMFV